MADRALADTLPLRREDRQWSFLDFVWVQSGLAIATWAFLIGGVTATYVGFWDGLWTMLLGNCIGAIFMLYASALPSSKWGTEHYVLHRSIYGPVGVLGVLVVVSVLPVIGWTTILAVMFGKAAGEVMAGLTDMPTQASSLRITMIALGALAVSWLVLANGQRGLRILNRFVAPGLIVMTVVLMAAIFSEKTISQIAAAAPLAALDSRTSNLMLAIELNIAVGMSWWSLAANVGRSARTQRIAMWGSFIGYVPVGVLAQMVGLTAALVMGSSDPTQWMLPIVGRFLSVVLLAFICFANLTSIAGMAYANVQTFAQHLGTRVQQFGWAKTAAVFLGICGICVFFTETALYDRFFVFVACTQAVVVGAIGVTLADYLLLRRRHISLSALYNVEENSPYGYWRGTNYAALLSLLVGSLVYVLIFNPVTFGFAPVFPYVGASIPALVATMGTHLALTRWVVIPAGKGTYPDRRRRLRSSPLAV